jgi:hypothetical protein
MRYGKDNTINQLQLIKPNVKSWNMKEFRDFAQAKMPTSLPLMWQRCGEVQGQTSPDCLMHGSNNDDNNNNNMNAATVADIIFAVNKIAKT